jgi:hypothetical protein
MGGAVSELRGEIHTHVLIVQHYPMFLEPVLAGTSTLPPVRCRSSLTAP